MSQLFLFEAERPRIKSRYGRDPNHLKTAPISSQLWAALTSLLVNRDCTLHLSVITDEHGPILNGTYRTDDNTVRRYGATQTLGALVEKLTGAEVGKVCCKCEKQLPLDGFSVDLSQQDGHNRACRACERRRVKEYNAEKKRQRLQA